MNRSPVLLSAAVIALVLGTAGCPRNTAPKPAPTGESTKGSFVTLDGVRTRVDWSDGDTFKILEGPKTGTRARLSGFNTLEDYGPVHRWGGWTHRELYALSKRAGDVAAEGAWTCTSDGEADSYGRLLVSCPDVMDALLRQGLAMAFSVEGPASEAALSAQQEAQQARRGMWEKGVPEGLITSAHSAEEGSGYNRVVDTRTGEASKRPHGDRYESCEEVCVGEGTTQSCLVHVPYESRYGKKRAACLR